MGNNISIYEFHGNDVRALTDEHGEPWFVAKDVCEILGTETRDVRKILEDDEVTNVTNIHIGGISTIFDLSNGGRAPLIVSEAGLYSLIMRSRKPEAKEFRRWVTHEVLPSIRKHGVYATDDVIDKVLTDPDFGIRLLTELKDERARRVQAENTIERNKPKVLFADSVETADTSILVGELARDLRQNGVEIGQIRLFKWLRDHHYLISRKSEEWNQPTQSAIEQGLFEVKTRVIHNPDGTTRVTRTPKVTGKGRIYFTNLFLNHDYVKAA